jgi:hypothetical protein
MKKAKSIQIEGVQPIIVSAPKQGRPYKYPFDALQVGQAFWVPDKEDYVNIYVAVWRRNKANKNQKFVLSKGDKNGKPGFRVQRTE